MESFWCPGPVLVAGPCVLEDHDLNLNIARRLLEAAAQTGIRVVFKGSFDKANRSRADAPRGPGLERGIELLAAVRSEAGVAVLTDVHEPGQVERVVEHVDALQVPAFLCRQTDLLQAAGATGLPVNIKKGQWMSVEGIEGAVEKVARAGGGPTAVTERGTFFGYGDLVVDMRNFARLRELSGVAVLFDATHSVQQPGAGAGGSTGGAKHFIPDLLGAAAGAGVDGFFIETHPEPAAAPSDSTTMVPLSDLSELLERAVRIWRAGKEA